MPILLDDINVSTTQQTNTPHFFSTYLTGRGTAQGLLNSSRKPGRYGLGQTASSMSVDVVDVKGKSSGNSVTVRTIPFAPLTTASTAQAAYFGAMQLAVPPLGEMFHVTANATKLGFDVYLNLTPQGARLTEDSGGDSITRHLDVLYRMEAYVIGKGFTPDALTLVSAAPAVSTKSTTYLPHGQAPQAQTYVPNFVLTQMSYAPLDDAYELIADASRLYAPNANGVRVDDDDLAEWMDNYSLYDAICAQADVWNGPGIGEVISDHITALFTVPQMHGQVSQIQEHLNILARQLRYLENYTVPLDSYRHIYNTIHTQCPEEFAEVLIKQNLNLLMNGTLANLETLKPQLAAPQANPQAIAALPAKFSTQQREAITTDEPLSLTTAGAGTGKSTTILARIDYLVGCGINPKDITVLSFTNAAADNILLKNPSVGSMTIARMVLEIYKANYPTHQISTVDSIVNALGIFFPNDDMARVFAHHLVAVDRNQDGATTALNAFVERHFDKVMHVLDTIQQTCLELQIIVAYQRIDLMTEPPHLTGKFLIVDEVQDNSIFEFIYLLRYVSKHRQNMFIVGDASQTLYEFRSANPKALNALEGSGVFTTYRLTTNYRSNQEILDFANVHLAEIEANALSKIRLQANSLAQPTAASFQERVTLAYHTYSSQKAFRADLSGLMHNDVKKYVDACLARGEKVAFLAFTKVEVTTMGKALTEMYPNRAVADITSKRRRPMTVFSQYVKTFWNDVLQVTPGNASRVIYKGITDNLDTLIGRNATVMEPIVAKAISEWWTSQAPTINGWVTMHQTGALSTDAFFDQLMRNLLDFEIDQNGIKQNILNQQNRERKEMNANANADLIVSTIHGVKGLEFDNVVVIHQFDSKLPEDRKRLYYVALTRAMKSEYVLSYGSVKKPRIETDYALIVDALTKREQLDQLRAQGLNVDSMESNEVEQALAALQAEKDALVSEDESQDTAAVLVPTA